MCLAPAVASGGKDSEHEHEHEQEEHVVCVMPNAWEQDTPCPCVVQEGTQNDCMYVPRGHNTGEAALVAMHAVGAAGE